MVNISCGLRTGSSVKQNACIDCEKVKWSIAVSGNHSTATRNHMPYGITQCYLPPGSGDFPALPQPKLVLDLATPEDARLS